MPGDAVTHKMQLLFWEKNEKYFFLFPPVRSLLSDAAQFPSFRIWFPTILSFRLLRSLHSKKFSDPLTGRSPLAPLRRIRPPPPNEDISFLHNAGKHEMSVDLLPRCVTTRR